jgi:alpha-glucosidase
VRPLILDFQDDPETHLIEDQFMVGDQLLVAPVLAAGTTSRSVYLPQGAVWIDYWTGQHYCGGETITVAAPLDHLPLFVRGGAILPHWPLLMHTDQARRIETIDFHTFVAPGQSSLFEDEGEGLDYQDGQYRYTHFVCRPGSKQIIITARVEGEYNPPYELINWIIRTTTKIRPANIIADGLPIDDWTEGELPNTIVFQTPLIQRLEIQHQDP